MSSIVTLNSDTPSIMCSKEINVSKKIKAIGPIAYKPHETDTYAHLIFNIIGQMLSNKAAAPMSKRMHDLCNGESTPHNISLLADEQIKKMAYQGQKQITFMK